jgi:DNA (cytosine-5)-methyltransferase 1
MIEQLSHFSLFTGIGGIDLAAEWAGFKTVGQCELAEYPTKVLEKHWPDVPRWRDIRSVTAEDFYRRTGLRTVDIISGGFPCQPFSIAGKRKGEDDDRYLWPEMLRVISEFKPTWVLGENVANLLNMGIETCLSDLEYIGYSGGVFLVPASAVNAPHRRDRVFIIGHVSNPNSKRYKGFERLYQDIGKVEEWGKSTLGATTKLFNDIDWKERAKQSGFLGRNNGVPNRLDRIKCLGNAVVPQQVYPILSTIKQILDMEE